MDTALTSALAALAGSSLGALTPVLNNYLIQRGVRQREMINREIDQREALYSEFIKEASRLYANSVAHNLESLDDLVALYALVSRIRLLASEPVLRAAEDFVKQILRHYGDPNLTFEEIRAAVLAADTDPLGEFSLACRRELRGILDRGVVTETVDI